MNTDHKPLYSLTIGEFVALTKELIDTAIKEKDEEQKLQAENLKRIEEHYSIKELATFLHCSKVSIHNYKKLGLPFYRIGRKILFKKQEVLNFMKGLKNKRVIID
jgi:excisionase family DNA binding protein